MTGSSSQREKSRSFVTGASSSGIRSNVAVYPRVAELCARFVKQQPPGLKFSSIACFEGMLAAPHLDPSNSCLPNAVMALSKFTGGEIWVQSKTGDSFREVEGCMLSEVKLSLQPCSV